jgi:hypothetical protein
MMSGRKGLLAVSLFFILGCGTRTNLRTSDAARFVDDDPWLKIDAAAGAKPDGGVTDARDARADGPG